MNTKTLGLVASAAAAAAAMCGTLTHPNARLITSTGTDQPRSMTMALGSVQQSAVTLATPTSGAAVLTSRSVVLVVGTQRRIVTTTQATVGALLAEQNITVSAGDIVQPAPTALLTAGTTVTVTRTIQSRQTVLSTIAFTTQKGNDATLAKGTTKVAQKGVAGQRSTTWLVTTTNGVVTSRTQVATSVVKTPVTQKVLVGTKVTTTSTATSTTSASSTTSSSTSSSTATSTTTSTASTAGLNLANAAMWDRIAQCESSGNWAINTGNGYYGGLQFNLPTWYSVNGQQFASRPDLATRAEQITVANRLYAQRGLQPWQCGWAA